MSNIVSILKAAIPNLYVGQVFKNYKELCSVLGLKTTTGKSKQLQIKEIDRFMELKRDGQKYIISKIYETPKEKVDKRVKYRDRIEPFLVFMFFRRAVACDSNEVVIICNIKELAYCTCLFNDRFFNHSDRFPLPSKDLEEYSLSEKQCNDFHYSAKRKINSYIESALKDMSKNYEIEFSERYYFLNKEESRLATDEEVAEYLTISNDTIRSFSDEKDLKNNNNNKYRMICETMYDIIKYGLTDQFFKRRNKAVEERFGKGTIFIRVYKIITTSNLIERAKERIGSYDWCDMFEDALMLNLEVVKEFEKSLSLLSQSNITPEQRDYLIKKEIRIEDENELMEHLKRLDSGEGCLRVENYTKENNNA